MTKLTPTALVYMRHLPADELPWSVMRLHDDVALTVHATREEAIEEMTKLTTASPKVTEALFSAEKLAEIAARHNQVEQANKERPLTERGEATTHAHADRAALLTHIAAHEASQSAISDRVQTPAAGEAGLREIEDERHRLIGKHIEYDNLIRENYPAKDGSYQAFVNMYGYALMMSNVAKSAINELSRLRALSSEAATPSPKVTPPAQGRDEEMEDALREDEDFTEAVREEDAQWAANRDDVLEEAAKIAVAWGPFVEAEYRAGHADKDEMRTSLATALTIAQKIRALKSSHKGRAATQQGE